MREQFGRAVAKLGAPVVAQRKATPAAFGNMPAHEAFMGSWPCLNSVGVCSAGSNAARLESEGWPIAAVAAHHEGEGSAEDRAVQAASLLRNLMDEFCDRRCVICGNLNKHEILRGMPDGDCTWNGDRQSSRASTCWPRTGSAGSRQMPAIAPQSGIRTVRCTKCLPGCRPGNQGRINH